MAAQTMIVSLEIGKETDDFMFGQMSKVGILDSWKHNEMRLENDFRKWQQ